MKEVIDQSLDKIKVRKVYAWVKTKIDIIMDDYEKLHRKARQEARNVEKKRRIEEENLKIKARSHTAFPIWRKAEDFTKYKEKIHG